MTIRAVHGIALLPLLFLPCLIVPESRVGADTKAERLKAGGEEHVVKCLQEALKAEQDPYIQMTLAKALIRISPEDAEAAQQLVKAMTEEGAVVADAYLAIEELIPASPPALIKAILPVLKDPKDINRRRAAVLLAKIPPQSGR